MVRRVKKYFGDRFRTIVDEFLRDINVRQLDCSVINQSCLAEYAILSNIKQVVIHPSRINNINWKRRVIKVRNNGIIDYALPDRNTFIKAGKNLYIHMWI